MKKIIWLCLFLCSLNLNAANTSAHDPGIINKQRIEYWLNKRADTQQTTNKPTVESYLANTERLNPSQLKPVSTMKARLTAKQANKQLQYASTASPSNALNEVKVLAILIDFPDLKYDDNQLVDDDTDMYYENYTKEHYQQLLFNEGGFIGPNNETLSSVYDYYYDASGASLTFSGQVYGWVRADSNAKTYGERVGNTRDINAPALIKEAVEKATAQFDIDLTQYDLTDLDDIDGDGIINEPNGIIDHVMVFHSSIGEESGGGYLGVDAIWSHRYYVFDENSEPVSIAGSSVKLSGYTINPIDASIGVVAHEFGHDLGLADEYDLQSNTVGEPVSSWSIMSTGSWAGGPRGSQPVMFSAQALEYLQNRYQGNWVNQLNLTMEEVNSQPQQSLVYTSSLSQQQSQIKVTLAQQLEKFKTPVAGDFQFYSGTGNNLTHTLSQTVTLPEAATPLTLSFLAYYSIERDYDLVQVKVNQTPLAGNYTIETNPYYGDIGPYITGDSFLHADAQQPNGFLMHEFDLTQYAGQTITLSIEYITDTNTQYYGFVADDLKITYNNTVIWQNNAEQPSTNLALNGFSRVSSYIYAKPAHYYIQLRAHRGVDAGLQAEQYSPGVLLWYSNSAFDNNNTTDHPGGGFNLVVDADQKPIYRGTSSTTLADTPIQVRDAAFSLYQQSAGLGDQDLAAISEFNDHFDYSFTQQAESGVVLTPQGFNFEIVSQHPESETAELLLSYDALQQITTTVNEATVSFNVAGLKLTPTDTFLWDFGDGQSSTELSPTHTYADYGTYSVTFSAMGETTTQTQTKQISITKPLEIENLTYQLNGATLSAQAIVTGGKAPYNMSWLIDGEPVSQTENLDYQFSYSGDYTLALIVTDTQGISVSQQHALSVNAPLQLSTRHTANNLAVQFNSSPLGGSGNYTYSWDYGDSSPLGTTQNPSHNYQGAGSYSVKLVLTDSQTNEVISSELTVSVQEAQSESSSSGGAIGYFIALLVISGFYRRTSNKV